MKCIFLTKLLDILLPPACSICGASVTENATLCPNCFAQLNFITKPQCRICGRPFEFDIKGDCVCAKCLAEPPLFAKARAAVCYDDTSKKIILPFKHADRLDLLPLMVKLMHTAAEELMSESDLIIPVPLHRWRLLKRKYNQSALLAQRLAKQYHKIYMPTGLKRIRATNSQGHLAPKERKTNVRKAFKVTKPSAIKGNRILLIDDVLTTGATANECTRVLLKAGAKQVCLLTFAVTVHK